jgi:hypothetical protein
MTRATGEPHSAARAHAQPDDGTDVPVFDNLELLVDAELEKLELPHAGEFPVDRASDMDPVAVDILTRNMRAGRRRDPGEVA